MTAYLRRHIFPMVILAAVVTFLAAQIGALSTTLNQRHLRSLPTTEFVNYEYVEFVDIDPNGRNGQGAIRMRSRSAFPQGGDIEWNDELLCTDPTTGDTQLVSTSTTERHGAEPRPEAVTSPPWHYGASYSINSTCQMRSTITVTINGVTKRQTVTTDLFET